MTAAAPRTSTKTKCRCLFYETSIGSVPDAAFQRWFEGGAADGFVSFESLPGQLEVFVEKVVPILQRRGIYKQDYTSSTLGGNLGLDVPRNRNAVAREQVPAAE